MYVSCISATVSFLKYDLGVLDDDVVRKRHRKSEAQISSGMSRHLLAGHKKVWVLSNSLCSPHSSFDTLPSRQATLLLSSSHSYDSQNQWRKPFKDSLPLLESLLLLLLLFLLSQAVCNQNPSRSTLSVLVCKSVSVLPACCHILYGFRALSNPE